MTKMIKKNLILAAAVGAVSLCMFSTANAQYRIDTGHGDDASNRIGGNGMNGGADSGRGNSAGVTGNDIVTGNVTAGKSFRGNVPYTDPRAFRGRLPEAPSDVFVRDSSGTPYAADSGANSNAQVTRPFYGDSRAVPPPDGFIRVSPGATGYIPSNQPDYRLGSDLRLGDIGQPTLALPQLGQTVLPGPVDGSENNTLLTMSSLYGVRQWNPENLSDQQFVAQYANVFGQNQNNNNATSLSDLQVDSMRREIQQAAGAQGLNVNPNNLLTGQGNAANQQNQGNGQTPAPGGNQAQPLAPMLGAPNNQALPGAPLQGDLQNGPLPSDLGTGEGLQARMLVAPAQQSTANQMLQARLDEVNGTKKPETDVERSQEFNKELMASKAAQDKQSSTAQPGANPPGAAQPGATNPPLDQIAAPTQTNTSAHKTPPPQIKSFAQGVKAKGLSDLLKSGEDLMKQGKWFSAIQQYDQAEQVVPNNMLIAIGRANAELGGSYYGRAEADIRRAFTQDPATLEGQYDLRTMIGDDRLQFLVGDLKDIAKKNPTQPRAPFLLAYIAYNTGNERMAVGYLDLAEKRAGAGDTFYTLVRKHWTLPDKSDTPAPDLNKQ